MNFLLQPTSIFIFALLSCRWLGAATPVVTNVVAVQRGGTKFVDIRYDVLDADGDLLKIRIEISHNAGQTYSVPAVSLTGDIGGNVIPGPNKLIIWNAAVDWNGEFSPQMKVKVIASDGRGFPGLEFGREVPPGGFLMGQDGGAEGIGPARHVNIPWSYWLSKYEITVEQYAEFLNTALAAGEITRQANSIVAGAGSYAGVPAGRGIYNLGDDIRWNLNKLEVVSGRTNLPVAVSWYGSVAFAQHYGYDLPTDAEWEKAARGADHDGLGEHLTYPWGNSISGGNANYSGSGDPFGGERTPVGYYNGSQIPSGPDMMNFYGLYDVIGNLLEWTRSRNTSLDNYPQEESLNLPLHSLNDDDARIFRGGSYGYGQDSNGLKNFGREWVYPSSTLGFRVARRSL